MHGGIKRVETRGESSGSCGDGLPQLMRQARKEEKMIKAGDAVKVIGKKHGGWVYSMNGMINHVYKVDGIEDGYYFVNGYYFYEDELEKVTSKHKEKLLEMIGNVEKYASTLEDKDDFYNQINKLKNYIEEEF